MPKDFEEKFKVFCKNKNLEINLNQIIVVRKLENFYKKNFKSFFSNFFQNKNLKKGFYLYGDVGVGKTMILDFFF